ncbi:MAG TPA: phosphate-starvation-inducible E-like protein [Bacteroidales bacterium]|nr:phosphate-starvation-inducible E-like protein [Bacteroidales bacterium]
MTENGKKDHFIIRGSNYVERIIIKALIVMMTLLLVVATLQLAYEFALSIVVTPQLVALPDLLSLFGTFLMVLIGIELLDTVKVYLKEHVMHVEVVILVAVMAVARKVIVMDFDKMSGLEIIGIGCLLVALAVGYYLVRKAGGCDFGQDTPTKPQADNGFAELATKTSSSQKSRPCRGNKQDAE